ncbi:hypothetical protein T02_6743 [Trichinella nativa]|uniref:Uncharacterized protein n=1 Tax=Trichinella nativa TaxID=6335 RepID=A0A0V1KLJ1_9BILA|nr:hypothetical protein T02_6743 [Trichinella nativa]
MQQLYKRTSWLREVRLEYVFAVLVGGLSVFRRDELEVLGELSRSATHPNRSGDIRLTVRDERYNAGSRTLRARSSWRIVVAE